MKARSPSRAGATVDPPLGFYARCDKMPVTVRSGPMLPDLEQLFQHSIESKLPPANRGAASTSTHGIRVVLWQRHEIVPLSLFFVSSETPIEIQTRKTMKAGQLEERVGRGTEITVRSHANLGKRIPPHLESEHPPCGISAGAFSKSATLNQS